MNAPIALQSRIVEAVLWQPANRFQWRDLVYLLWKKAKTFDFNLANEHELRAVLAAIENNEKLPRFVEAMEDDICTCNSGRHSNCPVIRFRKAIAE